MKPYIMCEELDSPGWIRDVRRIAFFLGVEKGGLRLEFGVG